MAARDIAIPADGDRLACVLKAGDSVEVAGKVAKSAQHVAVMARVQKDAGCAVVDVPTDAVMLRNVGSACMCVGDTVLVMSDKPRRPGADRDVPAQPQLAGTEGKRGVIVNVLNQTMEERLHFTVRLDDGTICVYPYHRVKRVYSGEGFVAGAPVRQERCNVLRHVMQRTPQHIRNLTGALTDIRKATAHCGGGRLGHLWERVERELSSLGAMNSSGQAVADSILRGQRASRSSRAKCAAGKATASPKASPKRRAQSAAVEEAAVDVEARPDEAVARAGVPEHAAKRRARGKPEKLSPWNEAVKRARVEFEARGLGKASLPKRGTPFGDLCREIYDRQSSRNPS